MIEYDMHACLSGGYGFANEGKSKETVSSLDIFYLCSSVIKTGIVAHTCKSSIYYAYEPSNNMCTACNDENNFAVLF